MSDSKKTGFWPTPRTVCIAETPEKWLQRKQDFKDGKSKFNPGLNLEVAVQLTLSLVDSHARTYPTPANAPASAASAPAYGQSAPAWLASCAPSTQSLKTSERYSA